ncbi:MAG TPA: hypothetical protein VGG67_00180 [Steroidobacteraceae bacterium]
MTGSSNTEGRKVGSLRELPQSIEPPHDLWPRIEAQLGGIPQEAGAAGKTPQERRALRVRWLAAAAMVACVAVGVWIGRSLLPGVAGGGSVPNSARSDGHGVSSSDTSVPHQVYVSDPRYERQRAALVHDLQARLAALSPPERAKVTTSLEAIEKAKKDLEQALGRDPGNALLQELLVNTYQDEMRVLTDVHEASEPGRGI